MNHYLKGLTQIEATNQLKIYGPNSIKIKSKNNLLKDIFKELINPLNLILVGAALISIISKENVDAGIIIFIVILNTFLSIFQKYKADKAIEKLQKLVNPKTKVYRDSKLIEINSDEIVPNDIIKLSEGDLIPADGVILESKQFFVQESTLTGESVPIHKHEQDSIFMGTQVIQGQANCRIKKTGLQTEFGKIANLTSETQKDLSPLQKEINIISKYIGVFMVSFSILFLIVSIIKDGNNGLLQNVIFATSIAVAAVPEGLPTTITLSLSLAVQKLAKKGSIIKSLSSVETLGSTDIIVSDKTGTLTRNEMTVTEIFINQKSHKIEGKGYEPFGKISNSEKIPEEQLKKQNLVALFCNDTQIYQENQQYKVLGDPTEGALITLAEKTKFNSEFFQDIEILDTIPFNSKDKFMVCLISFNDKKYLLTKGAPEIILEKCNLSQDIKKSIQIQQTQMAKNALRTIGLAIKEINNETNTIEQNQLNRFEFISLVGIIDPPRKEVKQSILEAKALGIKIIMATGDHQDTAEAIGKQIGFTNTKVINGQDFKNLTETELHKIIESNHDLIFARVKPEDKLTIVNACKQLNKIVAVTGDGVNDAPALKRADIGIAMGINGTEVSKEAADMILTEDNFTDIITAIKEGRSIYQNIQKFIAYLFSCNFGEILCIGIAFILDLSLPITAILLLVINLGTDILPAISLSFEENTNIKNKNPKQIINREVKQKILFQGLTIGISSFVIFYIVFKTTQNLRLSTTYTFLTLVISQLVNVFNTKHLTLSIFKTNIFNNKYLIYSVLSSATMLALSVYNPYISNILKTSYIDINYLTILIVIIIATVTLSNEINKYLLRRNSLQS